MRISRRSASASHSAALDQSAEIAPYFGLSHCYEGDTALVKVSGELDLFTGPQLQDLLAMIVDGSRQPRTVIVDLSGLSFLDAAGCLAIHDGVAAGAWTGELQIHDPSPPAKRVIDILGIQPTTSIVGIRPAPAKNQTSLLSECD